MKLAQALLERANLNRKLIELQERVHRNAMHQQGDRPSEDPKILLEEYQKASHAFERLIVRINQTNNATTLENGMTMVQALAKRDVLKLKHELFRTLAAKATPKQDRYSKSEIKFVSSVNVVQTQKEADFIAKELRELDALIQQINWTQDLIE